MADIKVKSAWHKKKHTFALSITHVTESLVYKTPDETSVLEKLYLDNTMLSTVLIVASLYIVGTYSSKYF